MRASEIYKIYKDLEKFVNEEKKLPVKIGWIINRNMKKMEDIAAGVEENRSALIQKYGERKEDGSLDVKEDGSIRIADTDNFMAELDSIFDTEFDISFDMITLEDIEKCDTGDYDKLSPKDIATLDFMVNADEQ